MKKEILCLIFVVCMISLVMGRTYLDNNNITTTGNITANWMNGKLNYSFIQNVPLNLIGNGSFNETRTNLLYAGIEWDYNQTLEDLSYHYNMTSSSIYFYNQSDGNSGNMTFNETRTNGLYATIQWNYNQTIGTNNEYGQWWYNMTTPFVQWAYNQTYIGGTYNSTYHQLNLNWEGNYSESKKYWYNMSDGGAVENGTKLNIVNITGFNYNYNQTDGSYNISYQNYAYNQTGVKDYTNIAMINKSNTFQSANSTLIVQGVTAVDNPVIGLTTSNGFGIEGFKFYYNGTSGDTNFDNYYGSGGMVFRTNVVGVARSVMKIIGGNVNLTGNISISQNNKNCLDGDACTKYIYYNGSNVIIQG